MKNWRIIESGPADAAENMGLDEALLCEQAQNDDFKPTLRVYNWTAPCVTIGYFQKYSDFAGEKLPVVRRLTGGLSVVHGSDLSYGLIVNDSSWEHIYDQEKTYELIHSIIKDALAASSINSEFVSPDEENFRNPVTPNSCVKTLYKHDLKSGVRKIVGSCQRRRGKNLLVQGSIHLTGKMTVTELCRNIGRPIEHHTRCQTVTGGLSSNEASLAKKLAQVKYRNAAWNNKY